MAVNRLLHVVGSPRADRSRSGLVANRLIERLGPPTVETLDLFATSLPEFDRAAIEGRYDLIEGRNVDPAVAETWQRIADLVAHFLSFDTILFSVPMWNFGIPWRLKQYIDVLTQPGLAFIADATGVTGLAAGRQALLVVSGALDIRPGSPDAALDFQLAYMRAWLAFIGITAVEVVHVRPTYGSPEQVEQAMAIACQDADALAERLLRPARV